MTSPRVIVAEDDRVARELLTEILTAEGFEVTAVDDGQGAIDAMHDQCFELCVSDVRMGSVGGFEVLAAFQEHSPQTPVILLPAFGDVAGAMSAIQKGAYDYVSKPFNVEELKVTLRRALERRRLLEENRALKRDLQTRYRIETIVGASPAMLEVYKLVARVAPTTATVLVVGESGTGKELVAKSVHENSSRRKMPFVVINCGGIPENLLESELFGYIKGSFTGAYSDKAGLFEVANGGTVFLDEITQLPRLLQVKLLRVVQEKTFRRIGGADDIHVDVRIISATNQNLAETVKTGSFREDLYYRLNVIPLHLPPLRERKEDIPALTRHFIEKYSREFGKEIRTISSYALELLMQYPFPGNIRELENIIERSIALETSNIILPENLIMTKEMGDKGNFSIYEMSDIGLDLNDELAKFEKRLIEQALQRADGSKTRAAELLKISYDSLHYRSEKLGIGG